MIRSVFSSRSHVLTMRKSIPLLNKLLQRAKAHLWPYSLNYMAKLVTRTFNVGSAEDVMNLTLRWDFIRQSMPCAKKEGNFIFLKFLICVFFFAHS